MIGAIGGRRGRQGPSGAVKGRKGPSRGRWGPSGPTRGHRGPSGPYRGRWPQGNFSPASIVYCNKGRITLLGFSPKRRINK